MRPESFSGLKIQALGVVQRNPSFCCYYFVSFRRGAAVSIDVDSLRNLRRLDLENTVRHLAADFLIR